MSLLKKFQSGLTKTRDFITEGLSKVWISMGNLDEDALDEMEMLLIRADTGASTSMGLMDEVRNEIKRSGDSSKEAVIGTLKNKMMEILGETVQYNPEKNNLNIIILVGVNGTGKTTTAGKLCLRYKNEGKQVMLAAADTFRAAAIEQLKHWGDLNDTPVISHEAGSDPGAVVYDAVHAAIKRNVDVLIIDTAGRLHNKKNLMDELSKIFRIARREGDTANIKSFLIVDATTGQNAVMQAKIFNEVSPLDGIILTKLDSNAKGGIAIAVKAETKIPIIMVGLGEKAEDLVDFDPEDFVQSLFE